MINDHPIIKGHNKNLEAIHTALKRPKLNDQINHNKPVLFKTCITQTWLYNFLFLFDGLSFVLSGYLPKVCILWNAGCLLMHYSCHFYWL